MTDKLRKEIFDYLARLDLSAIESAQDKLEECRFFMGLASVERDRQRFRWLLSAFLSSAYSFFEMVAVEAHFSFCDDEGHPYANEHALDVLANYVKITKTGSKGRVQVSGLTPLAEKLWAIRRGNTHHFPLSIMATGQDLPNDFSIGKLRDEGIPALAFARDILAMIEQVQRELRT